MRRCHRLLRYALPYRGPFALILGLTVLSAFVVAALPWPMKFIVDHLMCGDPLPAWLHAGFRHLSASPSASMVLAVLALAGLMLVGLKLALESALAWVWTKAGRRMVYDVAEDLFARVQQRSLLFHTRNPVGDTLGRVATDSWAVYQLLDTLFVAPLHATLAIGAIAVLMAQLDGALTLLAIAAAPLMVGAGGLVGKPLRETARLRRDVESRMAAHVQQTLAGIPVVQAFVQEEREHDRFQAFADAAVRTQQRSTFLGGLNSLSSGLVAVASAGVILWFGARHVNAGQLTVGSLLVFLAYLATLQTQMKAFASLYTALQGFRPSLDRVLEVLDTPPEIIDRPGALTLPSARGHVRLERVTFGYEAGRPVLCDVTLEAKPGETIALVGTSGAGKTTLVNLIPRYFDPWQGQVLLDGHDVREVRLQSLRSHVAVVLQEPFLLSGTVAENIVRGRADASRKEIEEAAHAAQAHDFIMRLPRAYDTDIGERGAALSGGERQRLAIARALLKNAPVLILDEPTSALDAQNEQWLLAALEQLRRGRTTFLIAHRLSTVRRADRIVVLQEGRIAESGIHAKLEARGGLYTRLCQTQLK